MREGWMHVAGLEGQEKFSPRTLASAVKMTEGSEESVADKLASLEAMAGNSSAVTALSGRVATLETLNAYGIKARYVNANGEGTTSATVDKYIQIYNDKDAVWEWVAPPLLAGIEYRTIDRHNGMPLYRRLVDLEALPNKGTATITLPNVPLHYKAWWASDITSNAYNMLPSAKPGWNIDFYVHWNTAYIKTIADLSRYRAFILMDYLK